VARVLPRNEVALDSPDGQDSRVSEIRPAENADAARWLLRPDVTWWDLVTFGPPDFDAYVRIAFPDETEAPDETDEVDVVGAALATLTAYTTTPDAAYAAIWEGWAGIDPPVAPRVDIPHRAMLLFAGPVEALRNAAGVAWFGTAAGDLQEPHLVWPADQAWCLACEVDEEIEFTVGCSSAAYQGLVEALPGAVRRVQYGDPVPTHRDEQ